MSVAAADHCIAAVGHGSRAKTTMGSLKRSEPVRRHASGQPSCQRVKEAKLVTMGREPSFGSGLAFIPARCPITLRPIFADRQFIACPPFLTASHLLNNDHPFTTHHPFSTRRPCIIDHRPPRANTRRANVSGWPLSLVRKPPNIVVCLVRKPPHDRICGRPLPGWPAQAQTLARSNNFFREPNRSAPPTPNCVSPSL